MKKILKIFVVVALICTSGVVFIQAQNKAPDDQEGLFEYIQIFADAFSVITNDYLKEISSKELVYGAIKGMAGVLDGYSQFLDPDSFREITEETKGEFGGLGIEIGIRDEVLTVISPLEDTPAFKAGVKNGDKIVTIDGVITRDISLDEAVKKLRGKVGDKVVIGVVRQGQDKVIDIEIIRDIIKLKSISESKVIEGEVGYIRIADFQQRTPRELKDEFERLQKEGAKSFVIDVRNNPGGLLDAAIDSADHFLDIDDMIVYVEGRGRKHRVDFLSKHENILGDVRLVVLVNKGSASASEIFAGAIKDNGQGVILGTTTFGKGSVQAVVPLKDGSAIKVTTAAYYTPSGKNISDKGIEPDIYVENIPDPKKEKASIKEKTFAEVNADDRPDAEDDDASGLKDDEQLTAAVNVLKASRLFAE